MWAVLGVRRCCGWCSRRCTQIAPEERGVVTRFGRYSHTLGPGIGFTLPSPIDRVTQDRRREHPRDRPRLATGDDLMLTGDQNILDIAYSVRWNIRDSRALPVRARRSRRDHPRGRRKRDARGGRRVSLNDAIGDRRAEIETQVTESDAACPRRLSGRRSGPGHRDQAGRPARRRSTTPSRKSPPPSRTRRRYINQARAYALQLTAKAQGEAAAFDKVYEQYRLAPDVTRRRMYYETMEQVLSKVDKTIVEAPGVTPYLPLPEVAEGAAQPRGAGSNDGVRPPPPAARPASSP